MLRATTASFRRGFHACAQLASNIGRVPITFNPAEVHIEQDPQALPKFKESTTLRIRGPLGEMAVPIMDFVKLTFSDAAQPSPESPGGDGQATVLARSIRVQVEDPKKVHQRSMWGTTRTLIHNGIAGVSEGFTLVLRINGVGYRAQVEDSGRRLSLKLGYSHPIEIAVPEGIECLTPTPTRIVLRGIDNQHLGLFAAKIRAWRKPEPYNLKGIFVGNETIQKKEGKKK